MRRNQRECLGRDAHAVFLASFAVACGGFFMLRLSIEQGWFGPGTRVSLGALLALLLIAAGEWTRRKELITGIAGIASAHIPSNLSRGEGEMDQFVFSSSNLITSSRSFLTSSLSGASFRARPVRKSASPRARRASSGSLPCLSA